MMAATALVMFVTMFLIVFVLRTIIQKRSTGDSGVRRGVLASSFASLEALAGSLLVLALLAGVVAPIAELTGLEPLTSNPLVRGIGIGTGAMGIVLTFLAQMHMGTEWRIGIDPNEHTLLVTQGIFGVVRNPIFSALLVTAAGLTLMVPNPISLVGLVALAIAIELQVRFVEEPHLHRLHGSSYMAYVSRVGRFVPRLGRSGGRLHTLAKVDRTV